MPIQDAGTRMPTTTPFNSYRYDMVVAYVLKSLNWPGSVYDFVKIHSLVDALHLAETGLPVVGGEIEAWKHGPVVRPGYARAKSIIEGKEGQDFFEVVVPYGAGSHITAGAKANADVDLDEFSGSELKAMDRAIELLGQHSEKLYEYFHSKESFIGYAWDKAFVARSAVNPTDLLDGYEREFGQVPAVARLALDSLGT